MRQELNAQGYLAAVHLIDELAVGDRTVDELQPEELETLQRLANSTRNEIATIVLKRFGFRDTDYLKALALTTGHYVIQLARLALANYSEADDSE